MSDGGYDFKALSERLRTQDNRCTSDPMFHVEERRRIYDVISEEADGFEWVLDGETYHPEEGEAIPKDAYKAYYKGRWEMIRAFFTEDGAKDFIKRDGHNHGPLRTYVESYYRCDEIIAVRELLKKGEIA